MVSRDYTREIGVESGEKRVSKAMAVVVLLLMGVLGWFIARALPSAARPPESVPASKAQ